MDTIKETMAQMSQIFHQKIAEFEKRQLECSSPSTSNIQAEFSVFKDFTLNALRTLQTQVEIIARENDNLEMHTRRKILLLHGIPEDKKEDTMAVINKLVVQTLKLPDFKPADISRCHRMGRLTTSDRPRPILFKVRDMSLRSKIWASKTGLKGSGITMSEFLTKGRHDAFMAARQRYGVTKCWTRDGFVFVLGPDGERHRVSTVAELDKIIVPVAAAAPDVSKRAKPAAKELTTVPKVRRAAAAGTKK